MSDTERNTLYVVQFWVERYEYWSPVVEPAPTMFGMPTVGYETEAEGREKLSKLQEASPTTQYRLIRETTTREVI